MTMISDHEVIIGEPKRLWLIDLKNTKKDKYINITGVKWHISCRNPP